PTGLEFTFPKGGGLKAERDATDDNRRVIRDSTVENWVPYYVLEEADGDTITEGALLPCDKAHFPPEFSGLQMLSVLTIDGEGSLNVADAVGVLAGGETVYASTDSLYVATQRWVDWEEADDSDTVGITTQIHQFDITDPSQATYVASGEVTGFLLNQFAMSEHEGYLRVASTTRPTWWDNGGGTSESMVTVLKPENGVLDEVGRVDGLGNGEQIFAVRMLGDLGYVVTFRQTDPLYVIDLSNPANPTVAGDLKILGYSAYLHPLGDGLLLGVGQDATEEGRTLGTQVSVFDVSDPNNPKRLHQFTLSDAYSDVEYDHRAFLQWGDLVVIPIQKWSWDETADKEDFFAGALVLRISDDGIEEVGRVLHTPEFGDSVDTGEPMPWTPPIRRSLVAGDVLYTLSEIGVQGNALSDLDTTGFAGFGFFDRPFPPDVISDDFPIEEGLFDQFPVEGNLGEWIDDLLPGLELADDLALEDFGFVVDEVLGSIVEELTPAVP
ncbi:MAG: beta-propeller domain-containing protein, partial [Acidimicrobiia bacterium]